MIELPRPIVDKLLMAYRANNYLGVEAMGLPIPPVTLEYPLFRLDGELPEDVYSVLDHVGLSADVYYGSRVGYIPSIDLDPLKLFISHPTPSLYIESSELRVDPRSGMYIGPVRALKVDTNPPAPKWPGLKLIHDYIEYEDVLDYVELSSLLLLYNERMPDGNMYFYTWAYNAVTLLSLFDNPEAGDLLRERTPELAPVWDRLEELARETRVEYSEEDMRFFEAAGVGVEGAAFEFGPVITPKGRISIPDAIVKALYKKLKGEGIDTDAGMDFGMRFGCAAGLGYVIFDEMSDTVDECIDKPRLKKAYRKWRWEFFEKWDYIAELTLLLPGSYCVCMLGEDPEVPEDEWPASLAKSVEFAVRRYRPGERVGECMCFDASCRGAELDLRRLEELLDVYLGRLHRAIWRGLAVVERGVKAWEKSGMLKATTEEELRWIADKIYGNIPGLP
ncbi:hypothetical protein [Pyrobaculum neutrophilum]|uniref:Uncharacterized protein n=1 Tax=Pyrobaculum neutrophilum (strain DSM 2338 / JCM 9278 / NBRC 100436 / V24Sta) TaxID=444157 RepID=B1YAG9_PYRNV|nr:hypothetical protein [Pyrobaculum neutrophilum]ACB40618.1 hypothetical protein Tneu_1697 [Pyrobaculum neutrophilum V24Sta]